MSVLITRDDGIIDEVAVERALLGENVPLRPGELHEAITIASDKGLSAVIIAARLGISTRAVTRHRAVEAEAGSYTLSPAVDVA